PLQGALSLLMLEGSFGGQDVCCPHHPSHLVRPMTELPEPGSESFSRSALLEDQRKRWRGGEQTPVEDYLKRYPALAEDEGLVLDLLYNEVLLREERHETPAVDDYVRRFPLHAEAIRRLLALHDELKEQ